MKAVLKTDASSPVVEQVALLAALEESKHQGGIVWHLNVMMLERNSPSLSLGWVNWKGSMEAGLDLDWMSMAEIAISLIYRKSK